MSSSGDIGRGGVGGGGRGDRGRGADASGQSRGGRGRGRGNQTPGQPDAARGRGGRGRGADAPGQPRGGRGGRGGGRGDGIGRGAGIMPGGRQDTGLGGLTLSGSGAEVAWFVQTHLSHANLALKFDTQTNQGVVRIGSKRDREEIEEEPQPKKVKREEIDEEPRPEKIKREEIDEEPRPKKVKGVHREPEVIDENLCGNCGMANHKAAFCVKIGKSGWMQACPKCDSSRHLYETCPNRKREEDFKYLIFNRQRKPPVKSRMALGKVVKTELARAGSTYRQSQVMQLPYSSLFSRQEAREHPHEAYTYAHVGDPTTEAEGRTPEPDRLEVTLREAVRHEGLARQLWSPEEEGFDPETDGPMPTVRPVEEDMEEVMTRLEQMAAAEARQRNYLVRSRSVAASIMAERVRMQRTDCMNCGLEGHDVGDCPSSCGSCGRDGHVFRRCKELDSACICSEFPGHKYRDCPKVCEYCPAYKGDMSPHTVSRCPAFCYYCLSTGHSMEACGLKNRRARWCLGCSMRRKRGTETYHLPTECLEKWCPVKDCTRPFACTDHCKGCGWRRDLLAVLEVNEEYLHLCRFAKFWVDGDDQKLTTIKLRCRSNASHTFSEDELAGLRGTIVEETELAFKENDDLPDRPLECPTCRLQAAGFVMT
ncbi:hypothetical protein SAMD00023353_1002940 [Rosellinia necatrix]|uniref:CCHC-type domain-containing protein n=1 Tax=Rosellinia necatrix TaxID=77044 RepID=A0A1W2TBE5_ROSNE|nr:hypothetical protein SAMD00023353_1002940 [Rosellinia necatrix]